MAFTKCLAQSLYLADGRKVFGIPTAATFSASLLTRLPKPILQQGTVPNLA